MKHRKEKRSVLGGLALALAIGAFALSGWAVTHPQVGPRGEQGVPGYGYPGKDGADGKVGPKGDRGARGQRGRDGVTTVERRIVFRPARANRQCWVPGYPFWTLRPCSVQ